MHGDFKDLKGQSSVPKVLVPLFLASAIVLLAGCSTTIHPTYKPGAGAKAAPAGGRIALRVVDKIQNTAPLPKQIADGVRTPKVYIGGFNGPIIMVNPNEQMVTPNGPYRLDAPPAEVAHRIFKAALERGGLRVEDGAPTVLEVRLLRLEILSGTKAGELKVKIFGNVLQEASLHHNGATQETTILEQTEFDGGLMMAAGELGSFASQLLSHAAENTLIDEKLSPILDQLRQAKP